MTATAFCEYVNNHLLPSSHLPPLFLQSSSSRTAIWWLHHLDFKPKRGVYIDGHGREDVVKHRSQYLKTMDELCKVTPPPPQCADKEPKL